MNPRVIRLWLPSAVLLSLVPGHFPVRGPSTVTGTVGESLSVSCQYEKKLKTKKKIWCKWKSNVLCKDIVKTSASEEARNGRVSIRDHPDNLTFTVTLENLTLEDAGTYMCMVDIGFFYDAYLQIDKSFKVEVFVVPGKPPFKGSRPGNGINILASPTSSAVHTQPNVTTDDTIPAPSPELRSLLSSPHFWILVSLKLPLFLSMLGALLWVNRPQRCSGGSSAWPCYENQ
uniref:CMRF35-like molecule 6 n=1 Tax=Mus musculus TaxID=10090 RepID=CLM6_MOUSE|nr:RecName: Full=CMRF35-like molecule 6; Short=CLM-6; AltName: Full=CD300 antigen-like family member C; AltName: CD_antigen=CD300c; Flags: Precursor [Mus musculus]